MPPISRTTASTSRAARLAAGAALALALSATFAACGKKKLSTQECTQIRGKAFAILNEAAKCQTDADCFTSKWPGCAREANKDMLDRIKPIKDEYEQGSCEDPKADCPKTPEVFCNQYVCEKREKAIRTDDP
jgi:hypothetical protein